MRFNLKSFFLLFLFISVLNADNNVDTLTLTKIKKLVQKEEEIAIAYKKYILEKGENPTNISSLLIDNYLPKGFSTINPFGKIISLIEDNKIESSLPEDMNLKSNLYDYYYSNKYRTYTKAPLKIKKDDKDNNDEVGILLSSKEKFIYSNKSKITTTKEDAKDKYFLDSKGVLHWYDASGKYKFSFDNELLLDESVTLLNDDGTVNTEYKNLVSDVSFAGMTVLHKNATSNTADEYIMIGSSNAVKVKQITRDIGKTIIQFTRRAGGMIINGDIYTWGNNANKITGIDIEKFTQGNGLAGSYKNFPVITGLVRAKVKTYNTSLDNQNYFSSPLRPKFIDFFSTVYHGTCGISTKGELYCGGVTADSTTSMYTQLDTNNQSNPKEMFYRSKYFDGTADKKATKIFANNQIWLILANTDVDANGNYQNGRIYRWGYDFAGFAGDGGKSYNNKNNPTEISVTENNTKVLFKDITYLLTIGYRKMAALSNNGNVYLWGLDNYYNYSCKQKINNTTVNLCSPLKVDSDIVFASIQGGLNAFVAKGEDEKYYKISQAWGKEVKVESVEELIKTNYDSQYDKDNDSELISVDFTSNGIVWINSKNKLKGDYYTSENESNPIFKDSISKIQWKKIKVIEDDNGMCGIDIYNQMYCWGIQSFYRSGYADGNTFMIPVFNTNLYDLDRDFLVAEGGDNYLTNMTSDEWTTNDSKKPFFIKYPTYIGGFNYEFIFK
ncbi:hypothetical protein [Arcobacter defluvii]|uniref:Uncharacterized protein n=1 Tax=Arcobacter defluvii TaxID=873191 RepID=A0AAE7BE75_9BACT|nr:hypothetical protein [Arcobacter defluvii]QKF76246.1 hypothetical protein ADFLV_0179 [Arcobacter defluvii]RXI30928.1 hypothetical protein CP964_10745 [Arcobacter defluvii]